MKELVIKYWWVFVIVIAAPLGLNFLLQIPAFVQIVGVDADWLSFWGNYLGSSISTLTALFILFKTMQQNHDENDKNRIANKQENENNRRLQIKVLEYQQQMQWLNLFRQASAEYVLLYNANDLIAIANTFIGNPEVAHNMLKSLFDRASKLDTVFAYLRKSDETTEELIKKISPTFDQYIEVLGDIQSIIVFKKTHLAPTFPQLTDVMPGMDMSETMKTKIRKTSNGFNNDAQKFVDVVMSRISDIKDDMQYIRNILYDYIKVEQVRIDGILDN